MTESADKPRLDQALFDQGLVVSRARARDLVLRGEVKVDGRIVTKPSLRIGRGMQLAIAAGAGDYVSRGALKLRAALDHFDLDPAARVAIDVGASTGGFTEVLLQRGAAKVYAVDNGVGQLHETLRGHPRIVSLENTDARGLTPRDVPAPVGVIVADVSFISLAKALPTVMRLAAPECWLVGLIKPQFEAEPAWIPKDGVVTNPDVHATACKMVDDWLRQQRNWRVLGIIESPIKGGEGNTEFLIAAVREGQTSERPNE